MKHGYKHRNKPTNTGNQKQYLVSCRRGDEKLTGKKKSKTDDEH